MKDDRRKGGKAVVRRMEVSCRTTEGNNYILAIQFGSVREKGKKEGRFVKVREKLDRFKFRERTEDSSGY